MATPRLKRAQWTFAPASKAITFGGVPGFDIVGLVEVWHPTKGLIYDGYDETGTLGGTVSGNVLTLQYDTTVAGFAAGDALRIIYDEQVGDGQVTTYTITSTGTTAGISLVGFESIVLKKAVCVAAAVRASSRAEDYSFYGFIFQVTPGHLSSEWAVFLRFHPTR